MNVAFALLAVTAESLSLALGHLSTGLDYYRVGQNDKALHEFGVVLQDFADTPAADDALYWSAQAWQAGGDTNKAQAVMADLAKRFPGSPYILPKTSAPAAVTPAPVSKPPVPLGANLLIKKERAETVAVLNGKTYVTTDELAAALAALKQSQPGVIVTFQREDDIDLQMVVDAINALDKVGLTYKLP